MLEPFIDTIVICSMTALVIICTGVYETVTVKGQVTSAAFDAGLPGSGPMVALATLSFYDDRAVDYHKHRQSLAAVTSAPRVPIVTIFPGISCR